MENKKIYKNEIFNATDLEKEKEFAKYDKVTFTRCTFKGEVEFKPNINLRFSHCTFENEWKHVLCEKVVYMNCQFNEFTYHNIDKKKDISNNSTLFNCTFNSIDCEGIIFKESFIQIIDENKQKHFDNLRLVRCEFEKEFIVNVTDRNNARNLLPINLKNIDLSDSIFHSKFKMQCCNIEEKAIFYNTKFRKLADLYRTRFNEVNFEKSDFEDVSVFSEVQFKEDIDFKYTKFLGYSIFRDTVIEKKLNLRNTIFDNNANANFLDITSIERKRNLDDLEEYIGETTSIDVANRETARIIKDFYDKSNNIIEANKFYALEMQKMENELSVLKTPFEWLIFKMQSLSSDHSQSWILALLWIFILSFFASIYKSTESIHTEYILASSTFMILSSCAIYCSFLIKYMKYLMTFLFFLIILLITLTVTDNTFTEVAKNINPFSIMLPKTEISMKLLIYKAFMAYLIYQFIISVRQNTRRK